MCVSMAQATKKDPVVACVYVCEITGASSEISTPILWGVPAPSEYSPYSITGIVTVFQMTGGGCGEKEEVTQSSRLIAAFTAT